MFVRSQMSQIKSNPSYDDFYLNDSSRCGCTGRKYLSQSQIRLALETLPQRITDDAEMYDHVERFLSKFSHEFITTLNDPASRLSGQDTEKLGDSSAAIISKMPLLVSATALGHLTVLSSAENIGNKELLKTTHIHKTNVDFIKNKDQKFFIIREYLRSCEADFVTWIGSDKSLVKKHPLVWHVFHQGKLAVGEYSKDTPLLIQYEEAASQLKLAFDGGIVDETLANGLAGSFIANPDVISGSRQDVAKLFERICAVLEKNQGHHSMGEFAFNLALHSLQMPVSVGAPFVSLFGQNDIAGDFWVINQ